MSLVLGIDISTTATKAILVDRSGVVKGVASANYGYETPQPLWSEQSPESWWEGTASSIRDVMEATGTSPGDIEEVGLTGQMHGSVLLDGEGDVVRPAILWNDQRTGPQCDEIRRRIGKQRLIEITGNDALTGFTAPKLLWVQEHEPENWAQVRHVLLPKDYVRFRLTGDYAVDVADGSGTILFDLKSRTWSPEVIEALDIAPDLLPAAHEGTDVTGVISEEAAPRPGCWQARPWWPAAATSPPMPSASGQSHQGWWHYPSGLRASYSPRPTALPSSQKDGSMPFAMQSPVAGT